VKGHLNVYLTPAVRRVSCRTCARQRSTTAGVSLPVLLARLNERSVGNPHVTLFEGRGLRVDGASSYQLTG
jgi:hypothetical protein